MSNAVVKSFISVSMLLGWGALVSSCASIQTASSQKDDPIAVTINTERRKQEVKDSLVQNGVDSILVYSTYCRKCSETPYIPTTKELGKANNYIFRSYLKPTYVLWCHNGVYQIKKMDQSFESKSTEVNSVQFAHLFDYYGTYKNQLNSEDYLFEMYDTTFVNQANYGVAIDTVIETTEIRYFSKEYYSVPLDQPFRNYFIIEINIGEEKEAYEIDDLYFNPWAPKSYEDTLRSVFPNQKVIVGNSKNYYQINHGMKRFSWHQKFEAALFDLETMNSWTDE